MDKRRGIVSIVAIDNRHGTVTLDGPLTTFITQTAAHAWIDGEPCNEYRFIAAPPKPVARKRKRR